jgi:hypothetical protein
MENTAILNLEFSISDLNNPMNLVIDSKTILPNEQGKATFTKIIKFPSCIYMEVSGKGKYDTIIDEHGNVVKDKYIKLEKVQVNSIIPNVNFLKKWPRIAINGGRSNQIIYSDYFGFNGTIELEFEGNNVFEWLLRTNKFRDNNWHQL